MIERLFRGRFAAPRWLRWFIVFHVVVLAWIPFRAPDLNLAGDFDVAARRTRPGDAVVRPGRRPS